MAARIITHLNSYYNKINIAICQYPRSIDKEARLPGPTGRTLPRTAGFPSKYEPPGVSFKTYRSLVNFGNKEVADTVLKTKKRSFITPNLVWNGVMAFSDKRPKRTTIPEYARAKDKLRKSLFIEKGLIPIYSMDAASQHIPRSTSPGLPWINLLPGKKKGDILDTHMSFFRRYWNLVGQGKHTVPLPDCAAFARSHISDPKVNKVRPIWAYPLLAIVQEARFSIPLTEALKSQQILPQSAYGMEMMKGGMVWLNNQALSAKYSYPGCKFMMVDYSSFDSSIPAWLIRDAFSLLREKLDFSHMVLPGGHIVEIDPHAEEKKFRKLVNYFINTPIRNSDGRRFIKDHGVPSGSMFTNIIDTVVNLLITYTLVDATMEIDPIFALVFGDDGLICLPDSSIADLDAYSENGFNIFGVSVNTKKSYATREIRNIHFLGYYNGGGTPLKNPLDLIASMMYPQYEKDDWSYCISRALGCLLASAGTSTDVFRCAQSVWIYASRFPEHLERGIDLLTRNPRSRRFLDQMGCGELPLSQDYFFQQSLSIPGFTCTKLRMNIKLC